MKRYDWAVFLLTLAPVYADIITNHTAGIVLFFYAIARIVYSSIFKGSL